MPFDSSAAENTSAPPAMPPSVRVAVLVMGVLAALLLTNAALLWYGYDVAVDRLVAEGQGVSRAEARSFVLRSLVPYLVIGLVLAVSAWFLPQGRSWARWTGLTASGLLTLLSLVSAVTLGALTIGLLLVLVLAVAAAASLLARPTAEWLPRRGRS